MPSVKRETSSDDADQQEICDMKKTPHDDKPEQELARRKDGRRVMTSQRVVRAGRKKKIVGGGGRCHGIRRRKRLKKNCVVVSVERDRSRSPLNLTVSPSSRRSTDSAAPTPSPAASDCPAAAATVSSLKSRLVDFFSVSETSAGVLEDKTRALCTYYVGLCAAERSVFLRSLATEYGLDRHCVHQGALQVANNLVCHNTLLTLSVILYY
jgi:hypothetical protein